MTTAKKTPHPTTPWKAPGEATTNTGKEVDKVSHGNTWENQVARGRVLVTEINDRKWELGDLANEVCPAGRNGERDNGRLWSFAAEIGVTPKALEDYRRVAAAWPAPTRVGAQTYTTHKMLAGRDDRQEIIAEQTWTYNSLATRLDRLPNPSRVSDPAPATTAALSTPSVTDVQEALRDPQVAKQVFEDRTVTAAADRAIQQVNDEAESRADERKTPAARTQQKRDEFMDQLRAARRALDRATDALGGVGNVPETYLTRPREELREMADRVNMLLAVLDSSVSSLDEALADLLGGEGR